MDANQENNSTKPNLSIAEQDNLQASFFQMPFCIALINLHHEYISCSKRWLQEIALPEHLERDHGVDLAET